MNLHDKQRVVLIVLCIPLLCMGTFALGAVYGHLRMYLINHDVFALAEQLGYTPDALLIHRVYDRDFSPFFPWDTYCEAKLFYTTPLSTTAFTQKVNQAIPEKNDARQRIFSGRLFQQIDVTVSDSNAEPLQEGSVVPREQYIVAYYWPATDGNSAEVRLYETANISPTLNYKGNKIQDNVVEIYLSGGTFPIWMDCPRKTTELAPPSK